MSSWKSYGGINKFETKGSISADVLSINKLNLKQVYQGNFDICGQLNIYGGVYIKEDVDISGDLNVTGNTILGIEGSEFIVNASSVFEGPALFNNTFTTVGNISTQQNIIAQQNVFIGNVLYFEGGNVFSGVGAGPFIYGNVFLDDVALGINTMNPQAALDISTNLTRGLNIMSYNDVNENIIAQNSVKKGVSVGADLSTAHIYFYSDNEASSGVVNGSIAYSSGGYMNIDVSQNLNVTSQITISTSPTNIHNHGETLSVYDISNGVFFGNIYQNPQAYTGSAASFISSSNDSNTMIYMGTPQGAGAAIGGGSFPNGVGYSMATIGLTDTSGNYTMGQMIINGNALTHNYTTTGINTFQPRVDKYVLDVNGPLHIDNGDIMDSTGVVPFELYSMSMASNNNQVIAALGSSLDISGNGFNGDWPREQIIYTTTGGNSWKYIDISNDIYSPGTTILKGNTLTGIHLYDSNNWFISGFNNQLILSNNGGESWQNISTTTLGTGLKFSSVYINKFPNPITGNLIGYISDNTSFLSSKVYVFDISASSFNNSINTINIAASDISINNITRIKADSRKIYISGNGIAVYNMTAIVQTLPPPALPPHLIQYTYNDLTIYDNSYAIAVGNNIISATVDGGINWSDLSFNNPPGFTGVYMIDSQNVITVGSYGNIWFSNNRGFRTSWAEIPMNIINASGKASWLLSSSLFRNVVMPDINTILITNTIQSYNFYGSYGKSNIFSVYVPNLLNKANNSVLDISGTVRITGDIQINDGGSIVSNNQSMNLFNTNVTDLFIGGSATNIVLGNVVGTTHIQNNLSVGGQFSIEGKTNLEGDIHISGNLDTSGSLLISSRVPSLNTTTGALVVNGGVGVSGNMNVGGRSYFGFDTSFNGNIGIARNLNVSGRSNFVQDVSFNGNVLITGRTPSLSTGTGSLIVSNGVGIGGNLNVGGRANFIQDVSLNGNINVNNGLVVNGVTNLNNTTNINSINMNGPLNMNNHIIENVNSMTIPSGTKTFSLSSSSGGTTYNIGLAPTDIIQITGKLNVVNGITGVFQGQQVQVPVVSSKTFQINNVAGNATSGGAGIEILDNSGVPSGYIQVGYDLQSMVFKTPNKGTPDVGNIYQSPYQISPDNKLRLAVNELTLRDISNIVPNRGLIILQPDLSFQLYQESKGHKYGDDFGDADYAINICPDFDISNIMLKNFDSVIGTQTIGSNVNILGDLILNGNVSSSTGTLPLFGNLLITGNTLLLGNVGIGTSSPLVLLDVSGSSRFTGPLISTNYDTLRFSNNYGYEWKNNNNVSNDSYYQDIASSYDGKYQYALVYDKYSFGSVSVSSNYGESWSSTPLPSSYAGNIIYQAVPYMRTPAVNISNPLSNTQTYRFQDLAGNISLANAIPLNIQVGTYTASASSYILPSYPYFVFDNSNATYWLSINGPSNGYTNGIYVGPNSTSTINATTISGEYVEITLPYSFCLTNYRFYPLPSNIFNSGVFPTNITVCGSNDRNSWYSLSSNNIITIGGDTYVSVPNNQSYNTYRFIINSTNGESAHLSTAIARIDLGGIFQNVTGSFSSSIAASGSGQYVTVANQGYHPGTGNLYLSADFGQTFQDIGQQATAVWQGLALSQTGQYQVAIGLNRSGSGNIVLSSNYGSSWSPVFSDILNGWQTVSMSSSGQYITAIQATTFSNPLGNIWVSSNYGQTWSSNQQIYNYTQTVNSFLNLGTIDFNKTVAVSSTGQYQTALGLSPSTSLNGSSNANIWISSNYGVNWSDSMVKAPVTNGKSSILSSVSMTGSGQNQVISYVGGNTGASYPTSAVYGNILVSSTYGSSWVDTNFKAPTRDMFGNTYYGYVTKVQSALNGQYIVGVSKYADISGNTYNNVNSTVGGVGNVFISSIPMTGLFMTQFMGSSNTNGVSQTHGLQLSVPTVNNASLMMGYDVNLDSAYINSADNNGANMLGINTTGGFVGVGKATPMVELDVSGSLSVSGNFVIGGSTVTTGQSTFETVNIVSTAQSTSETTGAITVAGGAGIGGNVNVGGLINSLRVGRGSGNVESNTVFGAKVLEQNTTGSNNTAIGWENLRSNTTGSNNTAIGFDSLSQNTTGNDNTGTGRDSLSMNTTGNNNTAIGGAALEINTTGNNNTATGQEALLLNTIGSNCTAAGRSALRNNTTGSNNTAFGRSSGATNTTGSNNTYLGHQADTSANNFSNSTALGVLSRITASNQIVLGTASEHVSIPGTNESTNTTSGALRVSGGAGIGGNLNVGGNLFVSRNFVIGGSTVTTGQSTFDTVNIVSTVPSTTTTSGALVVSGGAGMGGNLNVGGLSSFALDSTMNGNLLLSTVSNPLWFVSRNAFNINPSLASGNDVGIFYGVANPGSTGLVISPRGNGGGIKMDIRGNVGIGTSTPVNTLDVVGNVRVTTFLNVGSPSPPTSTTGNISASGQIAAQSFNATSDYRMKNNIQPLLITRTVDKLNPIEYDMSGGNHDMGFLAHEVQEVLPFLVSGEKDGHYMQSMNYNGFIALLVKEIQELKKENKIINARLENIEKKIM